MLPIMLKAGNSWREAEIYRRAARRAACQQGLRQQRGRHGQAAKKASWGRETGGTVSKHC